MNPDNEKFVIVMRKDLGMKRGKIASQAAHAATKVFFDRTVNQVENDDGSVDVTIRMTADMHRWKDGIYTKICLRVDSEDELMNVYQRALDAGLPACLIVDSGLTVFNGVPTKTCIGIGPAKCSEIDAVTGELPLLS